jgi:hypothetical protein
VNSAKLNVGHGHDKTGYIDAIIQYGSTKFPRWKSGGMTNDDRQYMLQHLNPELMKYFGCRYPDMNQDVDGVSSM